jgi:hypothetical protein
MIIATNKVVVGLKLWENGNSLNQQLLTTLSLVFLFIFPQTEMKLKNTLLAYILQFPLLYVLVFGVQNLTDLSIWWCVPIAFVLDLMYYAAENIRRGEE